MTRNALTIVLLAACSASGGAACSGREGDPDFGPPDAGAVDLSVDLSPARDMGSAPLDAGPPPTARLVAPLATSIVTTHRPTLRVELGGGTQAEVEVCSTRDCATPTLDTVLAPTVSGLTVHDALTPGLTFWRTRSRNGELGAFGPWSATWSFRVPVLDTASDTSYGGRFDFDGDGLTDFGWTESLASGRQVVHVLYGARTAALAEATDLTFGSLFPRVSAAGDLNGDGCSDAFVSAAGDDASDPAVLLFGSADRSPSPTMATIAVRTEDTYSFYAIGDANGDGFADMFGEYGAGTTPPLRPFSVWTGSVTGASSLLGVADAPPMFDGFTELGDRDADGWQEEVAVAERTFARVEPSGGFDDSMVELHTLDAGVFTGVAVGDFDGDGRTDIAAGVEPVVGGDASVYVLHGDDPVTFDDSRLVIPPPTSGTQFGNLMRSVGDTDGDGYDDLIVVELGRYGSPPWLFRGGATGLDASRYTRLGPGWAPSRSVTIAEVDHGDFDGDGLEDIVLVRFDASAPITPSCSSPRRGIYEVYTAAGGRRFPSITWSACGASGPVFRASY